jgi:hypothetical protein
MKKHDEIEDLFRSAFTDFEVAPPPSLKEAIDREIGFPANSKRGGWKLGFLLLALLFGAAACLFVYKSVQGRLMNASVVSAAYDENMQEQADPLAALKSSKLYKVPADSTTQPGPVNERKIPADKQEETVSQSAVDRPANKYTDKAGRKSASSTMSAGKTGNVQQQGAHSSKWKKRTAGTSNPGSQQYGGGGKSGKATSKTYAAGKSGKGTSQLGKGQSGGKGPGKRSKSNKSSKPTTVVTSAQGQTLPVDGGSGTGVSGDGNLLGTSGTPSAGIDPDTAKTPADSTQKTPVDSTETASAVKPGTPAADAKKKQEPGSWLISLRGGPTFWTSDKKAGYEKLNGWALQTGITCHFWGSYGLSTGLELESWREVVKIEKPLNIKTFLFTIDVPIFDPQNPDSIIGYDLDSIYATDTMPKLLENRNQVLSINIPFYFNYSHSIIGNLMFDCNAGIVLGYQKTRILAVDTEHHTPQETQAFGVKVVLQPQLRYQFDRLGVSVFTNLGYDLSPAVRYEGYKPLQIFGTVGAGLHWKL